MSASGSPLALPAQPRDGEVREIRAEPVMPGDQLSEAFRLSHREGILGPAPEARQVDVLAVGLPVVFGPGLEVGVRQDAEALQHVERAIDRGGVDARDAVLNPPGGSRRADMAL